MRQTIQAGVTSGRATWGGARKGAGRKKISDRKITFRCPSDIYTELEKSKNMSYTITKALRKFFDIQPPFLM